MNEQVSYWEDPSEPVVGSSHDGVVNHVQWCVAEARQIAARGRPAFVQRNCSVRCALFSGSIEPDKEEKLLFLAVPNRR